MEVTQKYIAEKRHSEIFHMIQVNGLEYLIQC